MLSMGTAQGERKVRIRILVFGAAGVGKTSLCNSLTGGRRATDNGPLGVTAKSHLYAPFSVDEHTIEVIDTVGLHESVHGTVPPDQAVQQLIDLLHKSKDGFSLLVHVTRASRITQSHDQDFEFFVDKLMQRKVPVVLAVTGCENEEPMTKWVERHHQAFERFGYAELISTCFASGGPLEPHYAALRAQSREALIGAILKHSTEAPVLLYGESTGSTFSDRLTSLWNDFVDFAKLPKKYRRKVNESATDLLKRLGVSKQIRDLLTTHIPDMIPGPPVLREVLRAGLHKVMDKIFGREAST